MMLSNFLDTIINKEIVDHSIPGAVIAVEEKGRILHRKAYGRAGSSAPDEHLQQAVPLTVEHIFDLASLTKVYATTFAFMLLVDQGRVALDEPVCRYLECFSGSDKKTITIRHLFTHTSGLLEWSPLYLYVADSESAIALIGQLPLKWKVGEGRHYSDLGFMVLGYLAKVITGHNLDSFLSENLFQPLGLRSTCFQATHCDGTYAATSVGNPFEKNMIEKNTYAEIPAVDLELFVKWRDYLLLGEVNDMNAHHTFNGVAGHAGLFSTVDDLLVLSRLILNRGSLDGRTHINESTIDQFITRDRYNNALGWAMEGETIKMDGPPAGTIGHTGFCGTSVVLVPARQISIVLLTNRQQAGLDSEGNYPDLNSLRYKINRTVITCL